MTRTRRVPFFTSRPSVPMLLVPTGAALVGAILPYTGLVNLLGVAPLPTTFLLLLFAMVVVRLLLVELPKTRFYRTPYAPTPPTPRRQSATCNQPCRTAGATHPAPGVPLHPPPKAQESVTAARP